MALFLGSAFFACVGDVGSILLTDHANRLLSSDSIKFWTRISRLENGSEIDLSACSEHQGFAFGTLANAADTVYRLVQLYDCEDADTLVLYKAVYDVQGNIDDEFTNELLFTHDEDSVQSIQVLDLTSRYLRVTYEEEGTSVEEVFTFDFE